MTAHREFIRLTYSTGIAEKISVYLESDVVGYITADEAARFARDALVAVGFRRDAVDEAFLSLCADKETKP